MFAGWTSQVIERVEAGRLAGNPANTSSVYPMRL